MIETAAYALNLGIDPLDFLDKGHDEHLILIALMKKAMKLSSEQKIEEIKVLAEWTGLEVAKVFAKIF
jgi:hypothetical protein